MEIDAKVIQRSLLVIICLDGHFVLMSEPSDTKQDIITTIIACTLVASVGCGQNY